MGSAYGYEIESALPLARLRRAPGTRGVLSVRRAERDLLAERGRLTVLHDEEQLPAGGSFAIAAADGALLVACGATGSYRIEPRAGTVLADPRGGVEAWEHRLFAVVMPLLLSERGDLILHAAAVEVDGHALAFAGPTTRGKSTLALALARLGHTVLSEDGVAVEPGSTPTVWPAATGVRVREPGNVTAPRRIEQVGDGHARPLPLGAIVLLEERGRELRVEPLGAAEALTALAPNLLHSGVQEGLGPAFGRLADVLGGVPAFRASLPDDLDALPGAAAEVTLRVSRLREAAGA